MDRGGHRTEAQNSDTVAAYSGQDLEGVTTPKQFNGETRFHVHRNMGGEPPPSASASQKEKKSGNTAVSICRPNEDANRESESHQS